MINTIVERTRHTEHTMYLLYRILTGSSIGYTFESRKPYSYKDGYSQTKWFLKIKMVAIMGISKKPIMMITRRCKTRL